MRRIFHVYASQGENDYMEMDLPATDYEMLDMMERLRLEDGQLPYLEILEFHDFDYLAEQIAELPDVYQLNALARRLSELDSQGSAAFEGFVGLEIQKEETPIPLNRLIDFAHSGECCHVVAEASTDYELGRFLAEGGFVPEAEDLPDAAYELLDFARIGKAHREANNGVFTGWGYMEPNADPKRVSQDMDFRPHKPAYTVLLNMACFPASTKEMLQVRLPTPANQLREVQAKLGVESWKGVMCAILDSPIPEINRRVYLEEDIPLIVQWAEQLQALDARGELPKYKALLSASERMGIRDMMSLAETIGEYSFDPALQSPMGIAADTLKEALGEKVGDLLPYVNLHNYGCFLMEQRHSVLTAYGMIERKDGQPIQAMKEQPQQGGLEMM